MILSLLLLCSVGLAVDLVPARTARTFFRELDQFRTSLLEKVNNFEFPLQGEVIPKNWQPSNRIIWNAITCQQAGVEYRLVKKVFGDGPGGNKVYRAIDNSTGQVYAYKQFGNGHDFISEVAFYMQSGTHEHLLKPVCVNRPGSHKERAHGGLLMEWFDGEDSLSWAARSSVKHSDIARMNSKIQKTLSYIHSLGLVHADLKPENILINWQIRQMKIIDFGFTSPVNSVQPHRGNPRIVAPELAGIGSGRIGFGIDWWAFGVVVASLHGQKYRKLLGKRNRPYCPVRIEKHGLEWQFGAVPIQYSPATLHLIHTLLHPDPDMRSFVLPSNLALLRSHPYFNA